MTGNTTWRGLYLTDAQQKHLVALENSYHAFWCSFLVELHDDIPSTYPYVGAARAYRKSPQWQMVPVSGEFEAV